MKKQGSLIPCGKLGVKELERLLKRYATKRDRSLLIGPAIGVDSAAVRVRKDVLLLKTDPITFVAEDIGLYALHINANDIAVMGGRPRWFLATILLPEGRATLKDAERVFRQISRAADEVGVTLCGGHTEVTPVVNTTVVVGQMIGEVERKGLVSSRGARHGDSLIVTKAIPLEALSILAREKAEELEKIVPKTTIARWRNFVKRPGIGVLKDVELTMKVTKPHAMHDPTEGGLSMGLYEMARASGVGLEVYRDRIPIVRGADRVFNYFGVDPMGLIASGTLLMAVDQEDAERVVSTLERAGIPAAIVGSVKSKKCGINIIEGGKKKPLRIYERDEITKIL